MLGTGLSRRDLVLIVEMMTFEKQLESDSFDMSARRGRQLESVPSAVMDEVLAKISTLFES